VIEHNQDSAKTYKLGINTYSDFTNDEFFEYFNLKAPQNECSATHKGNFVSSINL